MRFCDNQHRQICFEGDVCPACVALDMEATKEMELNETRTELEKKIHDLGIELAAMEKDRDHWKSDALGGA